MKNIDRRSLLIGLIVGLLVVGIPTLWLGHSGHSHDEASTEGGASTTYTCSMHPNVKSDKAGSTCPICGMDLTPASTAAAQGAQYEGMVMLSDEAAALANIETEVVGSGAALKDIRLYGKVQPNERLQQVQSAYVGGRVEQLFINAVGDHVAKGQTLVKIYSPELYTAEQELVAALNFPASAQRQGLIDAAVEKLKLLNVTESQISEVMSSKKASPYVLLKANTSGTVVSKDIQQGDYVRQGQPLLRIANLSQVWVMLQAYEADLPFVKVGQTVRFTSEALPGQTFNGKVSFIDPMLDAKSRTAGVRVVMNNPGGIFKPEMIVTAHVQAGMKREGDEIVVPKSAVLWTGKRSVVYVKDDSGDQPAYELRQITLGATLPHGYIVTDGLAEGEEIVTNGAFAIDASAQLEGKPSMMDN